MQIYCQDILLQRIKKILHEGKYYNFLELLLKMTT